MDQKQKLIIWVALSLAAFAAFFYFGVRPLIYPSITKKGYPSPEMPKSIQEQIREELIAPPRTQTPAPTQILKELSAPPPSPITSSSNTGQPSVMPSHQQILDSLLAPH